MKTIEAFEGIYNIFKKYDKLNDHFILDKTGHYYFDETIRVSGTYEDSFSGHMYVSYLYHGKEIKIDMAIDTHFENDTNNSVSITSDIYERFYRDDVTNRDVKKPKLEREQISHEFTLRNKTLSELRYMVDKMYTYATNLVFDAYTEEIESFKFLKELTNYLNSIDI